MSGCLQINSQKWNLFSSDGLKLCLPRQHKEGSVYWQTDWSFVAAEADAAIVPAEAPKLRLRLIGRVPGLRDWRDLENLSLGYHEPVDGKELPDTLGPEIWIWPPGETVPLRFGHWETDFKFGERHGHEFDFSLEALIRSERASKFRMDCHLKEFFQQPLPPDWELPEWADEVDEELSFAGRVKLKEIFCSVPINGAQPIEWAKKQCQRELAVEEFGPGIVTDLNTPGKYNAQDDLGQTGRVVILSLPTG